MMEFNLLTVTLIQEVRVQRRKEYLKAWTKAYKPRKRALYQANEKTRKAAQTRAKAYRDEGKHLDYNSRPGVRSRKKAYNAQPVWRKQRADHGRRVRISDGHRFDTVVELQAGVCAICTVNEATHADHDHVTGKLRGGLCGTCNSGIGFLKDDINLLEAAIRYLRSPTAIMIPEFEGEP